MRIGYFGLSLLIVSVMLSACNSLSTIEEPQILADTITPIPTKTNTATISPKTTIVPTGTLSQIDFNQPIRCAENYCIFPAPGLLQSPISDKGNQVADPSYRYGVTQLGKREPHLGIELVNPSGTPVLAANEGEVIVAGTDDVASFHPYPEFYGNLVIIKHILPQLETPLYTLYAHLSEISVEVGQHVNTGQKIGEVGSTGNAIGSHLHFEVRLGSFDYTTASNPELWLKPVEVEEKSLGILAIHLDNPGKQTFNSIEVSIRRLDPPDDSEAGVLYGETYASSINQTEPWNEIAVFGNIAPGTYLLVFEKQGLYFRANVEIESGYLTLVTIKV